RSHLREAQRAVDLAEAFQFSPAHHLESVHGEVPGAHSGAPDGDRGLDLDLLQPRFERIANVRDRVRDEPVVEDVVAGLPEKVSREVPGGVVLFGMSVRYGEDSEPEGPGPVQVVTVGGVARGSRFGHPLSFRDFAFVRTRTGPREVDG